MDETYVFSVGKSDFGAESVDYIHSIGSKAGIFIDSNVSNSKTDRYDIVVPLNFEKLDDELHTLERFQSRIIGFLSTFENYIVPKAKLGKYFGVPVISEQAARYSTDKALMRRAFEAIDPSITPASTTFAAVDEALQFAKNVGFPVIIKPAHLVKSLLVLRCDDIDELRRNVAYAQSNIHQLYEKHHIYDRTPRMIIEEFIVGDMYSIAAFVDSAGRPTFAPGIVGLESAQSLGRDDNYLYRRVLPADVNPTLETELYRVARAGITALGLSSTAAHIELIDGPNGVKLIEIGARTGGYRSRMYDMSYGISLVEAEVSTALDKPIDWKGSLKQFTAVYELFPPSEGKFNAVIGESGWLIDNVDYYSLKAKPGDMVGPSKNGYKACLVVIVSRSDEAEFNRLCRAVDNLSIEVAT
jgi:biotin carboxylase